MSYWSGMRYCPKCGTPFATGGFERTPYPRCDACGFTFYRGPVLAVGCLVVDGGRLLLVRRRYEPGRGLWCIPTGYVEYGETPEEGAAREVAEETGLQVRITRLYDVVAWRNDQDRHGVMIFYLAERVAGEPSAGAEVAELAWLAPDAVPEAVAFAFCQRVVARWRAEMDR